ncbi:MAG: hypothetical protein M1814_002012 [Vezdaea aestivalis]|nr:MAG: hypothetical protein M1814_002012 [Vezdaea aestivalis]
MNLFTTGGPVKAAPSTLAEGEPATIEAILGSAVLMGEDDESIPQPTVDGLDAHLDARAIVRLVQCTQCSLPLQNPLTLPCGFSLCRRCLPQLHQREHISYPASPDRQEGFKCPFGSCGKEHSVADCSPDVTLSKVMAVVAKDIAAYRPLTSDTPLLLEEAFDLSHPDDLSQTAISEGEKSLEYKQPRSRVLHGGRLVSTFTLAEMGELKYEADVKYHAISAGTDDYAYLDIALLEQLKEATRQELDCHVCYNLMLEPLTTTCGHTFCRSCLQRVLDHSTICPICRRTLTNAPSLAFEPSNTRLSAILSAFCPELLAQRASSISYDESGLSPSLTTPLFVCTLSYPQMPTFLHIFEPRYRLMIRRAMESGDRKFGMMMYNRQGAEQGDLGATQFMQYGTLLHIISVQMLPDGRSLIETVGVSRFRVRSWDLLDGYTVGAIERVDDVGLADEERAEMSETSSSSSSTTHAQQGEPPEVDPSSVPTPTNALPQSVPPSLPNINPATLLAQIDALPTSTLHEVCTGFITRMRATSAPWLHERVMAAYGPPPTDPALFPYWFASVLPIADEEKYRLLPTCSVRERLKICARWVGRIEGQRW